ncbi:endoplasmic reticulum resident protein 27 [Thomomys bottae]
METVGSRCEPRWGLPFLPLLLFLLACGPTPGVTTEAEESTDDTSVTQGPVWLADVPAAVDFVAAAEVTLIGFFQLTAATLTPWAPGARLDKADGRSHPGKCPAGAGQGQLPGQSLRKEQPCQRPPEASTDEREEGRAGAQDLEAPVVSVFHSVAREFEDVPFGITNHSHVLRHYNITGSTISLFRRVDNEQLRLEEQTLAGLDAATLSRFIHINDLRLVTEYNAMASHGPVASSPVTVLGFFNTQIQVHLLLIMDKASPGFEENLSIYRRTAKLFQGEILFVLVDSGQKDNRKVVQYFRLRETQLPALAIYRTLDDQWDTLPVSRVDEEQVKGFCAGFLAGKLLEDKRAQAWVGTRGPGAQAGWDGAGVVCGQRGMQRVGDPLA